VTAESLYQAIANAVVIFRQNDWVADIGTGMTAVTWTAPQTFAIVTSGVVNQVVTGLPATISAQYPGAICVDTIKPILASSAGRRESLVQVRSCSSRSDCLVLRSHKP